MAEVNETNCKNTTDSDSLITFDLVFATSSLSNVGSLLPANGFMAALPTVAAVLFAFLML